jgi:hypothetical protein
MVIFFMILHQKRQFQHLKQNSKHFKIFIIIKDLY